MTDKLYRCLGIMTGNSLDAVDTVITEFSGRGLKDVGGCSTPVPSEMAERFRRLKHLLAADGGDIETVADDPDFNLDRLIDDYMHLVAATVKQCLSAHGFQPQDIDAVGFHGQTCAHLPPSVAGTANPDAVYTLQIGDGQMLADLTGIPVVYDFRSDDLMNGGEGAPLAPIHNRHLAADLRAKGIFPVAFCNGGNTGNLAVISENTRTGEEIVIGFDTGPFNHFIDCLARSEAGLPCDFDGQIGRRGQIEYPLLRALFEQAVKTCNGGNFLLCPPPKSSDPAWYQIIPELKDKRISLENRIRTAEFFSAYIFAYSLKYIPHDVSLPQHFLTFGGGWRNPVVREDFCSLLQGKADVLPQHRLIFQKIARPAVQISPSDAFGYNGQFMEARIFADMAKCRLSGEAFSLPETTGCRTPTVGGIIARPGEGVKRRWSRAAKGWSQA